MPGWPSAYETTNRRRLSAGDWREAKRLYAHNYARLLPRDRSARILDLGCSEGIALQWLAEDGYEGVVGVDADGVAIEKARENLSDEIPEDQIVCADIREYLERQEDAGTDRIFMFNVIEHLEKPYLLDVLPEIRRVLKPGGMFVAQTGNIENPFNLGLFARDITHQIPFTCNSLRQAMLMGGFDAGMVTVGPLRYRTTLRNLPLQVAGPIAGWALKKVALSMRARIQETASMIYCVAGK